MLPIKLSFVATALVLLGGGLTAADAASDRDTFQKKVATVAPVDSAKGKALCACSSGTGAGFAL